MSTGKLHKRIYAPNGDGTRAGRTDNTAMGLGDRLVSGHVRRLACRWWPRLEPTGQIQGTKPVDERVRPSPQPPQDILTVVAMAPADGSLAGHGAGGGEGSGSRRDHHEKIIAVGGQDHLQRGWDVPVATDGTFTWPRTPARGLTQAAATARQAGLGVWRQDRSKPALH
jgi:hypothetical protein